MGPTEDPPTPTGRGVHARSVDPVVVVMTGVAGSGKTTVGARLAGELGWTFADADDDHPPWNQEKMSAGIPLDDADRAPWLEQLRRRVVAHGVKREPLVLACSALKASYRDALAGGDPRVRFMVLEAPDEVLRDRLQGRSDHWFPADLLASQRDAFEPPADAVRIDASAPLDEVVAAARRALAHIDGR